MTALLAAVAGVGFRDVLAASVFATLLALAGAGFGTGFLAAPGLAGLAALTVAGETEFVLLVVLRDFFAAAGFAREDVFSAVLSVFSACAVLPANSLRIRRATGASTVELADLTNSPVHSGSLKVVWM